MTHHDNGPSSRPDLVVHLSNAHRKLDQSWFDYIDVRVLVLVAAIVILGLIREIASSRGILSTLLLFCGAGAAFYAYYRLRQANVSVYVRHNRIGIANSLGLRTDVPMTDVAVLVMCSLTLPKRKRPLPVLIAVSKSGRCLFRVSGADQLPIEGLRRVASLAGLELRGSWSDTLSIADIEAKYPGTVPRIGNVFGWALAHRAPVTAAIIVLTLLAFLSILLVETAGH